MHGNNPPPPPSANPAIQAVNEQSPFEKIAAAKLQKFSDWENSAGPHDIMQAPGMNDMLDIYGSADSLANQKKMSNPAMALSGGGSGDYAAQLDELGKQNRYDQRAEGLSHGLQSAKAEAYGLGGSAADLEANRKQAYASDMLNQENSYYNRPRRPSPWMTALKIGLGGLNGAAQAGV